MGKKYVAVTAKFTEEGKVRPLPFIGKTAEPSKLTAFWTYEKPPVLKPAASASGTPAAYRASTYSSIKTVTSGLLRLKIDNICNTVYASVSYVNCKSSFAKTLCSLNSIASQFASFRLISSFTLQNWRKAPLLQGG